MTSHQNTSKNEPTFAEQVGAKAARKLKARRMPRRASGSAWA